MTNRLISTLSSSHKRKHGLQVIFHVAVWLSRDYSVSGHRDPPHSFPPPSPPPSLRRASSLQPPGFALATSSSPELSLPYPYPEEESGLCSVSMTRTSVPRGQGALSVRCRCGPPTLTPGAWYRAWLTRCSRPTECTPVSSPREGRHSHRPIL